MPLLVKRVPSRTTLRYQGTRRIGSSSHPPSAQETQTTRAVAPTRKRYPPIMVNGVAACRFAVKNLPEPIPLHVLARIIFVKLESLFPATFFRLPRGSVNLFQSFRCMIVGCKGQVAELTAHRVCNVLNRLLACVVSPDCYVVVEDLKYTNMSGTQCIGKRIDLAALANACPGLTDFHPERYKAVNYRFSQNDLPTNVTCSVYPTGSIVAHGATSFQILKGGLQAMANFALDYAVLVRICLCMCMCPLCVLAYTWIAFLYSQHESVVWHSVCPHLCV